jgi:hypothetical protein
VASTVVKDVDDGDARSWDFIEEVEEVLAMLGRRGRRDKDDGLKERLVMLVVRPLSKYSGEAPAVLEFWRWRRLQSRRVTATKKAEGMRREAVIRRTGPRKGQS